VRDSHIRKTYTLFFTNNQRRKSGPGLGFGGGPYFTTFEQVQTQPDFGHDLVPAVIASTRVAPPCLDLVVVLGVPAPAGSQPGLLAIKDLERGTSTFLDAKSQETRVNKSSRARSTYASPPGPACTKPSPFAWSHRVPLWPHLAGVPPHTHTSWFCQSARSLARAICRSPRCSCGRSCSSSPQETSYRNAQTL
jgi:hypothetical protein